MATKYNIQEILIGCNKQQPKYQRALVDQYSGLLYAICYRYLKDPEYAKDSLQESLMRIFQNLDKYDPAKGRFESWITTVTIRHCLSKLNKKKLAMVSTDDLMHANAAYDIEDDIIGRYDAEMLVNLIAELPDSYRTVFNLSAIDGYSHKEIGDMLGIKVVASRTRLNRAKRMLKEKVLTLINSESWVNTI